MRIELEDQGIKIKGHTLGSFNGWAEIDEDTGAVEKIVLYDDHGIGLNATRTEVLLTSMPGFDATMLHGLLSATIRQSDQVQNIVHERQQSLAHDRIVARSGDRAYNAEL